MIRTIQKFAFILCLALLTACSTTQRTVFEGDPKSDAERDYRIAVKTMESGSNEDAIKAFHNIKLKYPYATRWATLADLRIADAYRNAGDFNTAAVSYQDFIRTYPAHADVPYAAYQAANCYYELMPSDLFILPDPWQRDRKTTKQAATALSTFIQKFPDDPNTPTAKEQFREVRTRLANHEMDVAKYYFKQEAYKGTVSRLEGVIIDYPDVEVTQSAHILLAHAYLKLKDPINAKRVLNLLIANYPNSEWSSDAKAWVTAHQEVP